MQSLLSALGMLLAVLLVLAGAYAFTNWAGKNLGGFGSVLGGSGQIEVLDRAGVGKDQALLVRGEQRQDRGEKQYLQRLYAFAVYIDQRVVQHSSPPRFGVGKDQALLVVRAGQRYLLIGSCPAGLTLLARA